MEVILECYFDSIFNQLERASLLSKYKRLQLCEYFTTVIEACTAAGQCNQQDGCRHAVMAAMRKHDQTRADNGSVCLLGKFHNVLYVATKLCFDFRLDDSQLVAQLLKDLYGCEKTFERLLAGAMFGIRVSHFIAGWKCDFNSEEENVEALVYFLEHATRAKLRFDIGGHQVRRFVDVPMTSLSNSSPLRVAVQLLKPHLVLIFLRYGSAVKFDQGDGSSTSHIEPLLMQLSEVRGAGEAYPSNTLLCLKYLLRALPTIGYLPPVEGDPHEYEVTDRLCLVPGMLSDDVVPASRLGITPPELKHLCRCAVRTALWRSWNLPFGVDFLKLPPHLAQYIDLLVD